MHWFNYAKYLYRVNRREPNRYRHLYRSIFQNSFKNIMEIGVYRGINSKMMIETALLHSPEANYYGFDLFELMDEEECKTEFSKMPYGLSQIEETLKKTGATIQLHKGYTQATLPKFLEKCRQENILMDFIFIDGGHLLETIQNDWEHAEKLMHKNTVVIFDDYYTDPSPVIGEVGCQKLIDALNREKFDVKILEPANVFQKEWGELKINFVEVKRR